MKEWKENVSLQLEELELLRSMFPQEKELVLEDIAQESDLKIWMESDSDQVPPCRLAFRLNLDIHDAEIEISVSLPKGYPSCDKPEVYLRCDDWAIHTQSEANQAMQDFITTLDLNELMLGNVVAWIQGELMDILPEKNECTTEVVSDNPSARNKCEPLVRYWIYSHHIYSKVKRRDLLTLGGDFHLTGFSMPGKPGIICLEGWKSDCESAWSVIKSWNWQKIQIKFTEEARIARGEETVQRCFPHFQEIGEAKQSSSHYRMDMTEFRNFLARHNKENMFGQLFGMT